MSRPTPTLPHRPVKRTGAGIRTVIWLLSFSMSGFVACGERFEVPEEESGAAGEVGPAGAATPARYTSTFAFAGTGPGAVQLYVRFANRTGAETLVRDYVAWLARDNVWMNVLKVRDTLPVPRADWRILPAPGLRVIAGDGTDVLGLTFSPRSASTDEEQAGMPEVRLAPAGVVAEWTGLTGQRELLGVGDVDVGGEVQPGLFFFRRAARPATAPAARRADRIFLLADSVGNGLLIEGNVAHPDAPAAVPEITFTAWTWLQGVENTWSDVTLEPVLDIDEESAADETTPQLVGEETARAWAFGIPAAAVTGQLLMVEQEAGQSPSAPLFPLERFFLLTAQLSVNDTTFYFRGLGLESPLP